MHPPVLAYVLANTDQPKRIYDIGGRDINGSPRGLFPGVEYTAVDLHEGPGVDVVADVTDWKPKTKADLVLCLEVLEHAPNAKQLVGACAGLVKRGGWVIVTAACDPRGPHSAFDGAEVRDGEHYKNVKPGALRSWLVDAGLRNVEIEVHEDRGDVYAKGRK